MPAIKKRITAEYLEREQQRNEQNGQADSHSEGDSARPVAPPPMSGAGAASPLKRKVSPGQTMLKGLDGEVLLEKRKRTLPPGEVKLDAWLDNNLEKKADSVLSLLKLYQFYTDMCQQEAANVVEMDIFKNMLRNKFGKEFGLKEGSVYSGLLKTAKPRKKTVVATSLGLKMKDIIDEALKASGNPSKGMVFSWVKKFIAAKYPALQVDIRPHFLRRALEREVYAGRVELVKGIGFCGHYRQPGPPAVEEEPKTKKKSQKKAKQGEEGGDSAEDVTVETDKEEEGAEAKGTVEDQTDKPADKSTKAKKDDQQEAAAEDKTEEGQGEEKAEKKKPKRRKRPHKRRPVSGGSHSNPKSLTDVFPLALTYMAEPKEASFGRIRKYLERHYDKVDIDNKLKKCMEHGCDTGMWERVSGSGASGSFQLQVDSFDPEQTESLTDMVCSAIIACTEPKVASVNLLKNYISEYHPEFNIDTRPHKLKTALEKAEKMNQIRRVTGIGMTGSFQLVEPFYPSPFILAGSADEEDEEDVVEEKPGKEEVYVVRKTKSGRRAPVVKTQVDFSSTYKKRAGGSRPGGGKRAAKKKKPVRRSQYADSDSEEESSSSEEEVDSDVDGYHPRPSKSRGGGGGGRAAPPAKAVKRNAPSKAKAKAGRGRPAAKSASGAKKAKSPQKSPQKRSMKEEESEEEEEEDGRVYTPRPTKSGRNTNGRIQTSSPAKKRGRSAAPVSEDEQDYEIEEEPPAAKKGRSSKVAKRKSSSPVKTPARKAAVPSPPSSSRAPRSASKAARLSLREADSGDESDDAPTASRRTGRR